MQGTNSTNDAQTEHGRRLTRRDIIKLGGGFLAATALAACGNQGGGGTGGGSPTSGAGGGQPTSGAVTGGQPTSAATGTSPTTGGAATGGTPTTGGSMGQPTAGMTSTQTMQMTPMGTMQVNPAGTSGTVSVTPWKPNKFENLTLSRYGYGGTDITGMALAQQFQKTYPNIKLQKGPDATDQKILTSVASGDVPDLFWLGTDAVQSWGFRNALEQVDDLMNKDHRFDKSWFPEATFSQVQYDNKTYGVPVFTDVRPLWIELKPLQEVGISPDSVDSSNWQQLQDQGKKLVKKNGSVIQRWGFDPKTDGFFRMWSWGNGGSLLSDDGKTATFDSQQNIEALEFNVQTFKVQGGFQAHEGWAQSGGSEGQQNFFVQNQVGMTLFENWLLGIVGDNDPNHEFTVMPFKGKDGKTYSIVGGNSWAIPKGAKHKDAAWELMSFFVNPYTWLQVEKSKQQQLKSQNKIYTPSLTANNTVNQMVRQQVFKGTGHPHFDQAVELFPSLVNTTKQAASPALAQILDTLSNQVIKPALLGQKAPSQALKDGQQEAQKALDDVFKK